MMGWSIGYDDNWKRDIGYGVPAYCDHPDCNEVIHRGLSYVCANEAPYGGDGCGLYFCGKHLFIDGCERCMEQQESFSPKPDHPDWINWKLTDESWQQWRDENPTEVERLRAAQPNDTKGSAP